MISRNDAAEIVLSNRVYQYRSLQTVFGNEPSIEIFDLILTDDSINLLLLGLEDVEPLNTHAKELMEEYTKDKQRFITEAKSEYTRLFIGPNTLVSPPWESMHVGTDNVLFNDVTLSVRKLYAKNGYIPAKYPHVADDHISMELDFMARIAQRTHAVYCETKELDTHLLDIQKECLDEHLNCWTGDFASKLHDEKDVHIYTVFGDILTRIIETDTEFIHEI